MQTDIATDFGTSQSNIRKWKSKKQEIFDMADKQRGKHGKRKSRPQYKYGDVDAAVILKV